MQRSQERIEMSVGVTGLMEVGWGGGLISYISYFSVA